MGIHPARHAGDRKSKRQGLCKVRAGELGAGRDKDNINHALRHICLYRDKREGVPLPEGEENENHLAHACARLMMEIAKEGMHDENYC